jgi:CYTH domain-containing protein
MRTKLQNFGKMGIEIERKYLIKQDSWRSLAPGVPYVQGYFEQADRVTLRVRIVGTQGYLTLKGRVDHLTRKEFEYPIPVEDAREMLQLWCYPRIVEKRRYRIPYEGFLWEVDEFQGLNEGLLLAEIELNSPDQIFAKPDWIGEEVSGQPQYYNSNLAQHPYSQWNS